MVNDAQKASLWVEYSKLFSANCDSQSLFLNAFIVCKQKA
jgi:hypothetical protein